MATVGVGVARLGVGVTRGVHCHHSSQTSLGNGCHLRVHIKGKGRRGKVGGRRSYVHIGVKDSWGKGNLNLEHENDGMRTANACGKCVSGCPRMHSMLSVIHQSSHQY